MLTFPAWDCLPYDRASPALRVMAERLATLNALQRKRDKPQLLVATANAATQRLLTPFRIRQLTRRIAAGERIEREALVGQMNALGYQRADTVAEHGEYAVRGSLIDVFPAGEELALRLDFFGDEIDSIRRFDPADQRSTDKAKAFTLMPASEGLLDADTIKRFRSRYREQFGANATQDPLYQALSEGRRMAGMEHWLPLLEDKLSTLFDHLGEHDLILRDGAADKALEARREAIEDYYQNRDPGDGARSPAATGRSSPTLCISRTTNGRLARRPADPPRLALPRAGVASTPSISGSKRRAISLPSARSRPTSTKRSPTISPSSAEAAARSCSPATPAARASASAGLLEDHGAQGPQAWPRAGRRRSAARPSRRCSCSRSTTASPRPTSPCSPSRTCSATGSCAGAGSARPPPPSSKSWPRSRRATSWSTPTTASAATKG